jgi:hypothetical protein
MTRVAAAMELGQQGRPAEARLGEDYRTLGDLPAARRHLDLGLAAAGTLPDDGYGAMIRGGLAGLAERLRHEASTGG